MILFSAPGSTVAKKRAWLLTIPFDRAFQATVESPHVYELRARRVTIDLPGRDDTTVVLPLRRTTIDIPTR